MDLVDVVDLEFALSGSELHVLPNVADIVHAIVGGTVNLDHIKGGAIADFLTYRIIRIKFYTRPSRAIESLRQYARSCGFAGSAWADKEPGVGKSVTLNGIAERGNHMILAKHVCKRPRAVFSRKNLVTHKAQSSEGEKIINADLRVFLKIACDPQ